MVVSRLLLRRAHLLEGPGTPCRQADVEIADGRIVWMGPAGEHPGEGPSPSASGAPGQEVCGEGSLVGPNPGGSPLVAGGPFAGQG
jgi:cytosine/adenosine deaminase-related metal-dependent hydrolase